MLTKASPSRFDSSHSGSSRQHGAALFGIHLGPSRVLALEQVTFLALSSQPRGVGAAFLTGETRKLRQRQDFQYIRRLFLFPSAFKEQQTQIEAQAGLDPKLPLSPVLFP